MSATRKPQVAIRGVTNGPPFGQTPDGFTAFKAQRNFRARTISDRSRGGRREVLELFLPVALNEGAPVQAVTSVSTASAKVGYTVGQCLDYGGGLSVPSAALEGQIAALDDVPEMDWFEYLDVTPFGGPADNDVQASAFDPDGEFLAVASNHDVAGDAAYTLARYKPDTGIPIWDSPVHTPGVGRSVNRIAVSKLFTFAACASSSTGKLLCAYRNDTGAEVFTSSLGGWAREAVALFVRVESGVEYLYVALHGSPVAGTYTGGIGSGVIKAGRWALQFRSGIMKFRLDSTAYGGSVAVQVTFGTQLTISDPYFEAVHGYWRLSEHTTYRPHGGEFTDIRPGPNNSIYFAKRNQGWGPNDGDPRFAPDGGSEAYRTIGRIEQDGTLAWMLDTDSIKEAQDPTYPTYFNDLTFPGDPTPDPSINCLCVDLIDGTWYAAGRRNAGGSSVFAGLGDGTPTWSANIMSATGTVREGAATIDADGNPIFAGDRNSDWDGAGGVEAHVWKLDRNTGAVVMHFDLNESVSALSVVSAGNGKWYYTTGKVG